MLVSRIKVTTTTTGTGPITLPATGITDAVNGDSNAPAQRLSTIGNRRVPYFVTSGSNFCRGVGLISTDGLTLTRDNLEVHWNGTAMVQGKLSLTGTSTVIVSPTGNDLSAGNIGKSMATRMGAWLA